MSSEFSRQSSGSRIEVALIIGVIVVALAVFLFLNGQRQQVLRSSPSGFDGLQRWLTANEQSAYSFTGGWNIDQSSVGLLIVPVFDTALDEERALPTTKEELLMQQDEFDLSVAPLLTKAQQVPTLVVLPKWRSGMRLTRIGHPILLLERDGVENVLHSVVGNTVGRLVRAHRPFTEIQYSSKNGEPREAGLYGAQLFEGKGCEPIIGQQGLMLLADCPLSGWDADARVMVLSDPDLLNNHGLRLAENALIALDVLDQNGGDTNVIIDYSRSNWLVDRGISDVRERTWSDMLRFFEPPFTALWIGLCVTMILALWRSALRNGPVARFSSGFGAGRIPAIVARGRLMRLTNQDGSLLSEYVSTRISVSANKILGPSLSRHIEGETALTRYASRKNKALADQFTGAVAAIRQLPPQITSAQAIEYVYEFEQILEQIIHDT